LSDPSCPKGQTFEFPTCGPKGRRPRMPITGQMEALVWGTPLKGEEVTG
jgi:hypothetical protein